MSSKFEPKPPETRMELIIPAGIEFSTSLATRFGYCDCCCPDDGLDNTGLKATRLPGGGCGCNCYPESVDGGLTAAKIR